MGRKSREFEESAYKNNKLYLYYFNRLKELAISMFEWKNLPSSVDPRFLELTLFNDGQCLFFKDEVMGYLTLQCTIGGQFNVYRVPTNRRAYATNGYQNNLDETNSVIIYNNMLRENTIEVVDMFAKRLYDLDSIIDVNANAQKTPVLITCDETQRLTLQNIYMQYTGNQPVIYGNKNLDVNGIKVLKTDAPYIGQMIYELKINVWNEALSYLGISTVNNVKRERLITDEVQRNLGGTYASRYSRMNMRKEACKNINEMFGLNIDVNYRQDYSELVEKTDSPENHEESEVENNE